MNKKNIFFIACLVASIFAKAQTAEYLSEKKITKILEKSKKSGTPEWEIEIKKKLLYEQKNKPVINEKESLQFPHVNSSSCTNPGFEDGTTNGWTFFSGQICTSSTPLPCNTCPTTPGAIDWVLGAAANQGSCSLQSSGFQSVAGSDFYGAFPTLAPGSGNNYSMLLNNACSNGKIEKAVYSFVVSPSSNTFNYQYAVVLQSGGHPPNEQPYFHVDATDVTTGTVIPCTEYDAIAPSSGNLNGWSISPQDNSVYTYPWTSVSFDLSSPTYVGHTIQVEFIVSDCNQCGHFGYCYIDANCNSTQTTSSDTLCLGGSTTLSGPPGFSSYTWSGPVSGTGQNLFTGTPGNYTLTTTSAGGCSAPTLYYNLVQSATTSTTTVNIQVSKDTICSGTTTTLTASGANSYVWSNNSTSNSIVVSPTANTTYSVLGTDNSGCGDTAVSKVINVVQTNVSILATHDSICPGTADILTANGASTYTWSSNAGSVTTNSVSVSPSINSTYTVSGIDNSTGCLGTSIKTVIVKNCTTTGVNQFINYPNEVTVFPNPATETLYIECILKNATLYITDILGNKVKQAGVENELTTIDISSLGKGIYFLNVKTVNNVITKKFIVQR
jgi:hypothetical protein